MVASKMVAFDLSPLTNFEHTKIVNCYFATLNKSKILVVILLTLNKSKFLVVILLFEQVKIVNSHFTDFEQ